ncbi:MAG: TrkA family potassium uptake protein [Planctomycetes bacterium]|nr:TrkA family potassium uptake protein [Planctomycetota bacterium]
MSDSTRHTVIITPAGMDAKVDARLAALHNHYILCGLGTTGENVLRELEKAGRPFVGIEESADRIALCRKNYPEALVIHGDSLEDEVLKIAGIERARGLITTIANDRDNLVLTITALQLNPKVRLISRGVDEHQSEKTRKAGAIVVSPNLIGGRRLATEMLRPSVTTFLNQMIVAKSKEVTRFEAVDVAPGNPFVGKTLADLAAFEKTGLKIIAVRDKGEKDFRINPPPTTVIKEGMAMIVLGTIPKVRALGELVGEME